MKFDIPTDNAKYLKCQQKVQLRMLRSSIWSMNRRVEWIRFYKMWRKVVDFVPEPDEPHLTLGYLFGLVERINSKVTEPLLQMGCPFAVYPLKMGDDEAADNFAQVYRSFFNQPNFQEALRRSKKEMIITGTRWEVDEWLNIKKPGMMWGKKPQIVLTQIKRPDGTPMTRKNGQPFLAKSVQMVPAEVPIMRSTHYGFNTRFPSVFDMYPEPDRKTIGTGAPTDCSWLVEDMGELAIEDLVSQKYVDPADSMTKEVYDFGRLMHDRGVKARARYERFMKGGSDYAEDSFGMLITPTGKWNLTTDYHQIDKDTQYPTEGTVNRQSSEDRDKVWVVRHYEGNEILTIANGKYVIQRVVDPWHVPGIKARVENYTQDPEFLYGQGAIQPIEDEILAKGDAFNITYSNAIRLVNKMIAVREDAIVTLDDFKPRAGGKIRIAGATDVRQAIADVPQESVIQEMLALNSILSGEIEATSSVMDGTPGVQGSKPGHKTKGGLETIEVNYATRFITNQAQALINEARRGLSMEEFFSQFGFEKRPYRVYRDDGSTALSEFNKDDIYTEGRGFEFVVEVDPLWGNTSAQRQDALDLFEQGINYEKFRAEVKDPTMRKLRCDVLFGKFLRKFGLRDLSQIFVSPDGSMTPDDEFKIILDGGSVQCQGDFADHILKHTLQLNSPKLDQAVKAGKTHPDTKKNLMLLIEEDKAKLETFLKNIQDAAQKKMNQAGFKHPDPEEAANG